MKEENTGRESWAMWMWPLVAGFLILSGGCAPKITEPVTMVSEDTFTVPGTGQIWQLNRSGRLTDLEGVEHYLGSLNNGEYTDWRLPTKSELEILFTAFDFKGTAGMDMKLEGFYWLAGDYGGPPYVGTWEPGDQ